MDYCGRYEMSVRKNKFHLTILMENKVLTGIQSWDSARITFKYVSQDKFIIDRLDWPADFGRDSKQDILRLIVNEQDYWTKIE